MLLYKFTFISDLNLIPMFSVFLFFLIYLLCNWVKLMIHSHGWGLYQKSFQNLEYPDWLKIHITVWSTVYLKTWSEKFRLHIWAPVPIQQYKNLSGLGTTLDILGWALELNLVTRFSVNFGSRRVRLPLCSGSKLALGQPKNW